MSRKTCPRCGNKKILPSEKGKLRCSSCLYEFKLKLGGLRLKRSKWRKIIFWFVLGHSLRTIEKQTGISHYSVFKAVRILQQAMLRDVPKVFLGIVEVDETYFGGQKKNKRKAQLLKEKEQRKESKRSFGTTKQPAFGILYRSGKVWAELVDNIEAPDLIPIIEKKIERGTKVCSDTWRAYTRFATRDYVHRTVEHSKREYTKGKTISTALKASLVILKRNWLPREELKESISISSLENMSGGIIIEK